eukprot:1016906-Pelagomonas_calceolata.AAC.2
MDVHPQCCAIQNALHLFVAFKLLQAGIQEHDAVALHGAGCSIARVPHGASERLALAAASHRCFMAQAKALCRHSMAPAISWRLLQHHMGALWHRLQHHAGALWRMLQHHMGALWHRLQHHTGALWRRYAMAQAVASCRYAMAQAAASCRYAMAQAVASCRYSLAQAAAVHGCSMTQATVLDGRPAPFRWSQGHPPPTPRPARSASCAQLQSSTRAFALDVCDCKARQITLDSAGGWDLPNAC